MNYAVSNQNIHADRAVESPVAEAEGPWHAAIVYKIHVEPNT